MTFLLLTKARSGLPGKSVRFSEYRNPSRCTMDRIAISAPVFLVCTDAIILLLVILSTRSILHFMPKVAVSRSGATNTCELALVSVR